MQVNSRQTNFDFKTYGGDCLKLGENFDIYFSD